MTVNEILVAISAVTDAAELTQIATEANAGIAAIASAARATNTAKLADLEAQAQALRESMGIKVPAKRGPKPKIKPELVAA